MNRARSNFSNRGWTKPTYSVGGRGEGEGEGEGGQISESSRIITGRCEGKDAKMATANVTQRERVETQNTIICRKQSLTNRDGRQTYPFTSTVCTFSASAQTYPSLAQLVPIAGGCHESISEPGGGGSIIDQANGYCCTTVGVLSSISTSSSGWSDW